MLKKTLNQWFSLPRRPAPATYAVTWKDGKTDTVRRERDGWEIWLPDGKAAYSHLADVKRNVARLGGTLVRKPRQMKTTRRVTATESAMLKALAEAPGYWLPTGKLRDAGNVTIRGGAQVVRRMLDDCMIVGHDEDDRFGYALTFYGARLIGFSFPKEPAQ